MPGNTHKNPVNLDRIIENVLSAETSWDEEHYRHAHYECYTICILREWNDISGAVLAAAMNNRHVIISHKILLYL